MKILGTSDNYAVFSDDEKYRYQLYRIWNHGLPLCMFLMHNPSTADHINDDPTIRRCIGFAKSWGYGGIAVGNLTPYRATDPNDLLDIPTKALKTSVNFLHLNTMIHKCEMHVLAYGNPVRPDLDTKFGSKWYVLKQNKSGHPSHPLYLKKDLRPQPILPF